MPARRELHTGRHNFLHRSWGPFEPFDDSTFTILKRNGVYTHLVSDHYHYWEDGRATYHHRYSSWVNVRGQEGDAWKDEVADPEIPEHLGRIARQRWVNRKYMQEEKLTPQAQTFAAGLEFLQTNREQDNWYLQIETFDPHEPFFTLKQWKDRYNYDWDGPHFEWPNYARVTEDPDAVEYLRYQYAALLTQCDHYVGTVIDFMDAHDMWRDTMLLVVTDHGFLLGEHDWWGKVRMPWYNETAHIPLHHRSSTNGSGSAIPDNGSLSGTVKVIRPDPMMPRNQTAATTCHRATPARTNVARTVPTAPTARNGWSTRSRLRPMGCAMRETAAQCRWRAAGCCWRRSPRPAP